MNEFQVPNISCGHCAKAVTHAIHSLDPGARVEVDVAKKQVRVDSPTPRERLGQALADAGFRPQEG